MKKNITIPGWQLSEEDDEFVSFSSGDLMVEVSKTVTEMISNSGLEVLVDHLSNENTKLSQELKKEVSFESSLPKATPGYFNPYLNADPDKDFIPDKLSLIEKDLSKELESFSRTEFGSVSLSKVVAFYLMKISNEISENTSMRLVDFKKMTDITATYVLDNKELIIESKTTISKNNEPLSDKAWSIIESGIAKSKSFGIDDVEIKKNEVTVIDDATLSMEFKVNRSRQSNLEI